MAIDILAEEVPLPGRVLAGRKRFAELLPSAKDFGPRGIIVHGKSLVRSGKYDEIIASAPPDITLVSFEHAGGEPTITDVEAVRSAARNHGAQWLAAVGGGSVLDLGKAAAGLSQSSLTVKEHHQGAELDRVGIPFLAAPTTAGTGSEATAVSVLIDADRVLKKSVRHYSYAARVVILDPELLAGCPQKVVAQAGMDAFVQAVESYTSRKATWLSRQLSAKSIALINDSLPDVYADSSCPKAADLLSGSFLAGLALSMARLGVIHGLVHPLGVRYDMPHGLLCAAALPASLRLNRAAMGGLYAEISDLAGGDILEKSKELLGKVGIERSPLAGREIRDYESIIDETLASGSTQANPKTIDREDGAWLLDEIF